MFESLLVYCTLAFVMIVCCRTAVNRLNGPHGDLLKEHVLLMPEMLIAMAAFVFVFGCRWGVGVDFYRYLETYESGGSERHEFLFKQITFFLHKIDAHFSVFFGVWAFLDVFLLYYSIRKYPYIFPYVAFFLIFGSYYLPMMNVIRQHISTGIFMVSITYIKERKFVKYLACCFIALLFHKLSAILFVFYPLLKGNFDWFKSIRFQVILLALAIYLKGGLFIRMIEIPFAWLTDVMDYDNYEFEMLQDERWFRGKFGSGRNLGLFIGMLKNVPIILLSAKLKQYYKSKMFNLFYTLFFMGVLGAILFGDSIILNRVNYFLANFQMIIYSFYVYFCFSKENRTPHLFRLGVFLLLLHIPIFWNMLDNEKSTAQYMFFWEYEPDPIPIIELEEDMFD